MSIATLTTAEIKIKPSKNLRGYIKNISIQDSPPASTIAENFNTIVNKIDDLLTLQDIHFINEQITIHNSLHEEKIYLHELFEGSEIILPENEKILRNQDLEKRCNKLQSNMDNKVYAKMVYNVKTHVPEDTIASQLKQMNSELIAIAQFVITVIAGFAFGFIGLELIVGELSVEIQLFCGMFCALIVGVAELYFLMKKINISEKNKNSE